MNGDHEGEHAEFAEWDAAYVLGALTPADRRRFEEHLERCPRCREAVADLASMPGLLARAGAPDAVEAPRPPADLLERMRAREARRARGIRIRIAGIAAAAVLVVALAIGLPTAIRQLDRPDVAVAMRPLAETDMTVDVGLDPVAWGTRLSIRCDYPDGFGGGDWGGTGEPWTYELVVIGDDGGRQHVSTWGSAPGKTITLEAGTSLPLDRIVALHVLTGTGETLMTADLAGE
ncbi:anti-sigma factor family protein [Microbacterium rhizophilus]|uniref:anti-sigma factor family protein n=1 Tax=Microbacterium rhizophilus TaxID=3138934 RepID=UPI0031F0434C